MDPPLAAIDALSAENTVLLMKMELSMKRSELSERIAPPSISAEFPRNREPQMSMLLDEKIAPPPLVSRNVFVGSYSPRAAFPSKTLPLITSDDGYADTPGWSGRSLYMAPPS